MGHEPECLLRESNFVLLDAAAVSQAQFFNDHPPLYPWPKRLREAGLELVCKPREAMWKQAFESIGLAPGDKVLDVGCGTGMWLDRLWRQFGVSGTGIDISRRSLKTAMSESSQRLNFLGGDVSVLPFPESAFDFVFSLDVLEHVTEQEQCLYEMVRVLKPGGRLLLWTLNRSQRYTWNWWLEKLGVDVYERVGHHASLLPDVSQVREHLESIGATVEKIKFYNAFFTLALDEVIMALVYLFEKLNLFASEGKMSDFLARVFLGCTDVISRNFQGFLHWLDRPWVKRGYSNGFLIIADKMR